MKFREYLNEGKKKIIKPDVFYSEMMRISQDLSDEEFDDPDIIADLVGDRIYSVDNKKEILNNLKKRGLQWKKAATILLKRHPEWK